MPNSTDNPMDGAPTLAEIMAYRKMTAGEAIRWMCAIAEELAELHAKRKSYGSVTGANVLLEGGGARLATLALSETADNQSQDIVQFAGLLRDVARNIEAERPAQRSLKEVLERIAATNSRADSTCKMKKVASALKLLRASWKGRPAIHAAASSPQAAASAVIDNAAASAHEEVEAHGEAVAPAKPRRRILMLVREVPKGPRQPLPRRRATPLHFWAYFASAAGIAVTVCMIYLKFVR